MREVGGAIGGLAAASLGMARGIGCLILFAGGGWLLALAFLVLWLTGR